MFGLVIILVYHPPFFFGAFVVGVTLGCVAVVTGTTLGDFAVQLDFLADIFVKMFLSY